MQAEPANAPFTGDGVELEAQGAIAWGVLNLEPLGCWWEGGFLREEPPQPQF